MGVLFIYFLIFIAFILLFYWFLISYSSAMMSRLVKTKHEDTEIITQSGLAPPTWKSKPVVRIGGPGLAKRYAMWRIGRLIYYFQHTVLVDSESTRETATTELEAVRDDWRSKSWQEIFPYR
jgi:hypothetical protein